MAALAMVSSVAVFAAAPAAAAVSSQTSSFSTVSNVRMMAPLRVTRRMSVIRRANPQKTEDLQEKLSKSIEDAQKTCEEDPTSAPCAVAWDEVEELHAEASHQRDKKKTTSDPLEKYCDDNPETDECRVYED